MYHANEMGRVTCEMARPFVKGCVSGVPYGGYDYATGQGKRDQPRTRRAVLRGVFVSPFRIREATHSRRGAKYTDEALPALLHDALLPGESIIM